MRGGGKKEVVFPPKTSYKLGTDVKKGKQVGFLGFYFRYNIWQVAGIQIRVAGTVARCPAIFKLFS